MVIQVIGARRAHPDSAASTPTRSIWQAWTRNGAFFAGASAATRRRRHLVAAPAPALAGCPVRGGLPGTVGRFPTRWRFLHDVGDARFPDRSDCRCLTWAYPEEPAIRASRACWACSQPIRTTSRSAASARPGRRQGSERSDHAAGCCRSTRPEAVEQQVSGTVRLGSDHRRRRARPGRASWSKATRCWRLRLIEAVAQWEIPPHPAQRAGRRGCHPDRSQLQR